MVQSRNGSQYMFTCATEINTHEIDATFYRGIQRSLQFYLVDVVLILADSYTFWIYLYQFAERIEKSPTYAYRSSDSNILVGKFFSCHITSRVYRSTTFADHKYRNWIIEFNTSNQGFCFFACGTIAISNGFDTVFRS